MVDKALVSAVRGFRLFRRPLTNARRNLLVCDVAPNPPATRMIKTARARGFKTLTGLPMLLYHGANGFEMWTGRKAPEHAIRAALEEAFAP